jgi:hypothetical protein
MPDTLRDPLDYSTLEAQEAVRTALSLVLEVREQTTGPLARKVRIYETTLGLAVVPVLIGKLLLRVWRRSRIRKPRSR